MQKQVSKFFLMNRILDKKEQTLPGKHQSFTLYFHGPKNSVPWSSVPTATLAGLQTCPCLRFLGGREAQMQIALSLHSATVRHSLYFLNIKQNLVLESEIQTYSQLNYLKLSMFLSKGFTFLDPLLHLLAACLNTIPISLVWEEFDHFYQSKYRTTV